MVRGSGVTPEENQQQQSRETKHKKSEKRGKKAGEWEGQESATAGSMWPSLRLSVLRAKQQRTEADSG